MTYLTYFMRIWQQVRVQIARLESIQAQIIAIRVKQLFFVHVHRLPQNSTWNKVANGNCIEVIIIYIK